MVTILGTGCLENRVAAKLKGSTVKIGEELSNANVGQIQFQSRRQGILNVRRLSDFFICISSRSTNEKVYKELKIRKQGM